MQTWSLDTMGTTTSKVMVSTTTGQTANKIPVRKSTALTSRKTRSAKTTSLLQQTEGTYAITASSPRSRNQGCQVQDFAYTGGACTAVGRCTKEELIEELASTESHDGQGRLSNELTRPGLLVSYKSLDEVDMDQSAEEKRLSALGRGLRREQMQQASKHSGGNRQMVEYASTIHESHTLTSDQNREPAQKGTEPSSRIQLVQAITTNKVNGSYDPEQTQEKIAQRKLLDGLFKKEPASDGDQTVAVGFSNIIQDLASASQYSASVEGHKSPAGRPLAKLFQSKFVTDENHGRNKETKKIQLLSTKEDPGGEAGNPSTKEAPTKLFGRTTLTTNTPQATQESSANEAQNTSKKEGFGRSFNRTGQSTSAFGAARRPMNRSKTIGYSPTTTESTSNTTPRTQDSTTKEGSSTTVEYSLTTTENITKDAPKRKLFAQSKTIDEPGTTTKKEGRTKLFGRIGQSRIASTDVEGHTTTSTVESHTDLFGRVSQPSNAPTVPTVSGAQHQTMESHTTAVTVEGHTNEPQTTSMKAGRTKLFGRIGQSSITSTAPGASGTQNQAAESHISTTTVESYTDGAQDPSKKETLTKAVGSHTATTTAEGHTNETQRTTRNEGFGKTATPLGQLTSSSGLVSYSASTGTQRSRNKDNLAKFFQRRLNAKTTESAN